MHDSLHFVHVAPFMSNRFYRPDRASISWWSYSIHVSEMHAKFSALKRWSSIIASTALMDEYSMLIARPCGRNAVQSTLKLSPSTPIQIYILTWYSNLNISFRNLCSYFAGCQLGQLISYSNFCPCARKLLLRSWACQRNDYDGSCHSHQGCYQQVGRHGSSRARLCLSPLLLLCLGSEALQVMLSASVV